jgi:hypothetical protein
MIKISGLDKLTRQLKDASKALDEIDGELGTVSFNPHDPASIEAAIAEVEAMVDGKLGAYESNPIIAPLASEMKGKYRTAIIDKAAAARLGGEDL